MKEPRESMQDAIFPADGFSKKDALGQALCESMQKGEPDRFSFGFANRVAQEVARREARRQAEERKLKIGFIVAMMALLFSGGIGLQVFRPTALIPLLEGPLALVSTALACLILGARLGRNPKAKQGLPGS